MRLDKFLCETTSLSRKESKQAIKSGFIFINQKVCKDPASLVDENIDTVTYNGEKLSYEKYVYYMLNKPAGYVSATVDNISKTVIDLFNNEGRTDLFPIGRLDKDTVGLLIITNDGELSHHLTSPRHHINKTYYVECENYISDDDINKLKNGVFIDEDVITKPALVTRLSDNIINLTIQEGMYHQVKRMIASLNNKVIYLKRLSIGNVNLDETLSEGTFRRLTTDELKCLKSKSN